MQLVSNPSSKEQNLSFLPVPTPNGDDFTSPDLDEIPVLDGDPVLLAFAGNLDAEELLDVGGSEGKDFERSEGGSDRVGEDLKETKEENGD